ncbi:MAG: rhomboid family intramembrane serine protease [Promethearchaeota archaeon]
MFVLNVENLKDARITLTLIFINILCYLLFNLIAPENVLFYLVQINRNVINEFQVWRLFSSMFLHADPIHLFSNMLALLLFGATVENNTVISKIQFLIIYFISGLIGNLFSLFLLPLDSISLGASGAIFGLIGASFIIIATDDPSLLYFAIFYIIFFLVTSLMEGINFWAHIFGLLGGFLFGYLFYTRKRKNNPIY